jgi:hypothetical protein
MQDRSRMNKITAESLSSTWDDISSRLRTSSGQSFLQKELQHGPVSLSAVVRVSDGMPGLLLHLPIGTPIGKWIQTQIAGVRFEPAVSLDGSVGMPMILADRRSRDVFAILATDLANIVTQIGSPESTLKALFDRLALWRRFLQKRSGNLSDEEVKGLFGEITVFTALSAARGYDCALDAWKGPLGDLHDFRLADLRIEVKSWSNDSLPRVMISDPSQLVVDESDPLWLVTIELSRDLEHGRSLPNKILELSSSMDGGQKDLFFSLLADYGYLPAHAEFYAERYVPGILNFHKVVDGFPMIESAQIPSGVVSVKYSLNLAAINRFILPFQF